MFSINRRPLAPFPRFLPALHSTMFSINPGIRIISALYLIPLHSTMFSINRAADNVFLPAKHLYIPLCFLLIFYTVLKHPAFDLPLHSTMFSINRRPTAWFISLNSSLHSTMFSINPAFFFQSDNSLCTLHSTMFSINLPSRFSFHRIACLYIPLCFLLITALLT